MPGGRLGMAARASELTCVERAVGIDVALEVVADDAGSEDRPRLLACHAVGLAGPSLHPVGDVVGDAVGGHPVVEREGLDGRALEDGQDVDRDAW